MYLYTKNFQNAVEQTPYPHYKYLSKHKQIDISDHLFRFNVGAIHIFLFLPLTECLIVQTFKLMEH